MLISLAPAVVTTRVFLFSFFFFCFPPPSFLDSEWRKNHFLLKLRKKKTKRNGKLTKKERERERERKREGWPELSMLWLLVDMCSSFDVASFGTASASARGPQTTTKKMEKWHVIVSSTWQQSVKSFVSFHQAKPKRSRYWVLLGFS